jgi:tetratricopeptide (TPR) repeat protein
MRNHAITALLGLTCCLTACKEDPAEAHHRVAVEAFAKGEFAKAAAAYEEVIKLNPDLDERVQKKAASAWAKAEEYEKAAALLERLAAKKTGDEKIASELEIAGMYLQTARDLDQAETWFKKVLAKAPKHEAALSWLAEISAVRGGARNAAVEAKPEHLDEASYDIEVNPTATGVPEVLVRDLVVELDLGHLDGCSARRAPWGSDPPGAAASARRTCPARLAEHLGDPLAALEEANGVVDVVGQEAGARALRLVGRRLAAGALEGGAHDV